MHGGRIDGDEPTSAATSILFVMTSDLAKSMGHPFYHQLNRLLAEAAFDRWLEQRCEPYYAGAHQAGRKPIPRAVHPHVARRLF